MKIEHANKGWTCMDPDHDLPEEFMREEDFKDHIKKEHENDAKSEELDTIAEECFGDLQEDAVFTSCPFLCNNECGDDFATMGTVERELHVAKHLLLLAQISLSGHDPVGLDFRSITSVSSRPSTKGEGTQRHSQGIDTSQAEEPLFFYEDKRLVLEPDEEVLSESITGSAAEIIVPPDVTNWIGICDEIRRRNGLFTYQQELDSILKPFVQVYLQQQAEEEPVSAVARGLQVIAEGIDPMIEYVSLLHIARSTSNPAQASWRSMA
jgi:hypothetical protein